MKRVNLNDNEGEWQQHRVREWNNNNKKEKDTIESNPKCGEKQKDMKWMKIPDLPRNKLHKIGWKEKQKSWRQQ